MCKFVREAEFEAGKDDEETAALRGTAMEGTIIGPLDGCCCGTRPLFGRKADGDSGAATCDGTNCPVAALEGFITVI